MRYISQEKIDQLKQELGELRGKRWEIAKRLEEAKAQGDLSENMEYSEAREAQSFNEGRIMEIEQILKEAVVISKAKRTTVQVGSKIKAKSENGVREFMIVGSEDADPAAGKISNESPLGKAFIGQKEGDAVDVLTPNGKVKYKVLSIL